MASLLAMKGRVNSQLAEQGVKMNYRNDRRGSIMHIADFELSAKRGEVEFSVPQVRGCHICYNSGSKVLSLATGVNQAVMKFLKELPTVLKGRDVEISNPKENGLTITVSVGKRTKRGPIETKVSQHARSLSPTVTLETVHFPKIMRFIIEVPG